MWLRDALVSRLQARAGTDYQVVLDGRRIVEIHSRGTDEIPIGE